MADIKAEVLIIGRVQGVWFRQSTKNTANKFQVNGWCRNNPDGSVEAVFEGEETAVKTVVNWCRSGPDQAQVDDLQVKWETSTGGFDRFQIY